MANLNISEAPLQVLFDSNAAYRVLMHLENYKKGYASKIAKTFDTSLNQVQKQLAKFEKSGLLGSRKEGASRQLYFNKSPVTDELRKFLQAMPKVLPVRTLDKYYRERRRPRREGKR
ncbi:MAG: DUF2250 domain-containing protein [Gammaproteobacteria bacterium]